MRTKVMGILNVTPDSFSDGGIYFSPTDALNHAYRLVEEGADWLDVGAESTRPGHQSVTSEEEWRRLQPVLKDLALHCPIPISVDTYKPEIAARALECGVSGINDVWGALHHKEMLQVVSDANCIYFWMHNRDSRPLGNGLAELLQETRSGIERCLSAGIARERLVIDPGIGFAKDTHQNLSALRILPHYTKLGQSVLLGVSRKRFIGEILSADVSDRLEGNLALAAYAIMEGVEYLRVHDVKATVRVCRMLEAVQDKEDDGQQNGP
ncbi:dihydropteroate synthase [Alicyclobacillus tolerans]|uniref:dihydropteroate synthase n=1 Tax=Alicyclobacillus tolerans TaxID=90970 RepID=UPI003B764ECA